MARGNGHDGGAFDGLIDAFYETATAATRACAWCDLLPKVCNAFEASAGSLMVHDFSSRQGALRHEFRIRPEFRDAYNRRLSSTNPWLDSPSLYEEGAVVTGEEVVSRGDIVRTDFYNDFLEPQHLLHRLSGVISREGTETHLISLMRPPGALGFSPQDKVALSGLLPHLRRSIKVRDRVVRDRMAGESLAEFLDHIPVAFLLLGLKGQVRLQNRVAREMVARGDGLFVRAGGYLATASTRNTEDLRRLVAETIAAASEQALPDHASPASGEHFVISRGPGRLPLICVIYPVAGSRQDDEPDSEPGVALLVKDPQAERLDSLPEFASAYELTGAEGRLIKLLTAGQGLFEAAALLGITKNTARTHMRNIYAKVGTHRQADLVRLFAQFSIF